MHVPTSEDRKGRISECLDELKELMKSIMEDEDGENSSKLEKADILEVTVNYLNKLKNSDSLVLTPSVTYSHRFRSGFSACASEVSRFLSTPGLAVDRRAARRIESRIQKSHKRVNSLPPCVLYLGDQGNKPTESLESISDNSYFFD